MIIRKYLIFILSFIIVTLSFCSIHANNLSINYENTFQNLSDDLTDDTKTANVSTWTQFNDAMLNNDINNINVKKDFYYDGNNSGQEIDVNIPLRSLKINGEGHTIDFRGVSFYNNDTVPSNTSIKWNMNNLNTYGRNYYGPFKSGGATNSNNPNNGSAVITYENVNYSGAQLCSVYNFDAVFSGNNTVNSVNSYVSPFDNKKYSTQSNQNSIESTNLTITDNSTLNSTVDNAGVIYLDNNGDFKVGNNSHVNLKSNKASGENNKSALWVKNSLILGDDSDLSIETAPDGYQSICNMPDTNYNRDFKIGDRSKFNAKVDGQLNPSSTWWPQSTLDFGNNIQFNQGKDSSFQVDALNAGKSRDMNLLDFGNNSSFNQDENSKFKLNVANKSDNSNNLMYFGTGSNFKLGSSTDFEVNSLNSSGNNANVIDFDGDNFDLGTNINFKINAEATGSNFDVLNFKSNVNLNFDKVKNFEINMNKNQGDMFSFGGSSNQMNINQQDVTFRKTKDSDSHGFYGLDSAYIPMNGSAKTQNDINVNTKSDLTKNSFLNNFDASDFKYFKVSEETNRENNPLQKISKWDDFQSAMENPYVTNIAIENDLINSKDSSSHRDDPIPLRSIDFNGNNHKIDFRGISFYNNNAVLKNSNIVWNISDANMYGQNYYGPFKTDGVTGGSNGSGTFNYSNVNYEGAQLTASYKYTLHMKGTIKNKSANSYISPFNNKKYAGDTNQVNIEANNLIFDDGCKYDGSTENAGVIWLGIFGTSGNLTVGDNAVVNLTSNGTGGEGPGALTLKGRMVTGRNSQVNIKTRDSGQQTAIVLQSGSDNDNLMHLNKNSEVNIDDDQTPTSGSTDLVDIASNTNILIDDYAKFNIVTSRSNNGGWNSKKDIINASSNSSLEIGDNGSLKVKAGGDANLNLLDFSGNSQLILNNSRDVDIDARKNTNSKTSLISMGSGILESSEQAVSAWNIGNDSENRDYSWNPIKNMKVFYNGNNVTDGTQATSINSGIANDFKNKFKTQNFSRVLFNYIPDVKATIDNDLSPIKSDINSHQIRGTATPGAYIKFSGDPAIPDANISYFGSDDSEEKYHTIADEDGNYSYDLPNDKYFTAGNTVSAQASLGGKTYTASKKVKDFPKGNLSGYVTNGSGDKTDSIYRSSASKLNYTFKNTSGYQVDNPKIELTLPDNFNINDKKIESYVDGKFLNNSNVIRDGNKLTISYSGTKLNENQELEFFIPFNTDNEESSINVNSKVSGLINDNYYVDNLAENKLLINLLKSSLELKSVPDLDYGNVNELNKNNPISTINSQNVVVKDTLPDANRWNLELLPTDFYDNDGNKVDFKLIYNSHILDTNYCNNIYTNKQVNNGDLNIDLNKGIQLLPNTNNNVTKGKEYNAKLNWAILNAP